MRYTQLWGLGRGMSVVWVWGKSDFFAAQCNKPSLKLNNDQIENDKSGG